MRLPSGFAVLRSAGRAFAPVDTVETPASTLEPPARSSVRTYVFVLVLAVAVPLGALLVAALRQLAVQEEEQAATTVHQRARLTAAEADLYLAEARSTLEQVADRPPVRLVDPGRCDDVFADFSARRPPLFNLLLVDLEGRAVCSTVAPLRGGAYRDRDWFKGVVAGARFLVDAPHQARTSKVWIVTVAVPVRHGDGRLAGVLATGLDLAQLRTPTLYGADLPKGSTVELIDEAGTVVTRSSGTEAIGSRLAGNVVERALARRDGALRDLSYDGVDKVVGFAPVNAVPWIAVVSTPADAVFAFAKRSALLSTFAVLAILAAVLVAAAIVARRMLQPIKSIARVADAVRRGDLDARAQPGGPRELADIATEVNRMLDQRQRDEVALRDSEARFRQLFETSGDAILIVDRDNRIVFANPATERVFGHRPTALAGRELAALQPERFREAHNQGIRRFLATGERTLDWRGSEFVGLHADGHEIPVEVAFNCLRVGGADVFAAFVRDISRRKRVEADLRESEARFRVLADSAPSLIWMASADGQWYYVNRPWFDYTGSTLEQSCGDGWASSVHPDDRAALLADHDDAYEARQAFSLEFRLRRRDGEYRWVLNQGVPRLADDGTLMGYIGTCVDIHDRVVAEHRIRRLSTLYAALSRANEAMARTRDMTTLLQQVCAIAVEHGRFYVVNVGLIDDGGQRVRTVASAGETMGFFDRVEYSLAPGQAQPEVPSLIALRENRPYISNDRDHDARAVPVLHPAARGIIRSTAAFPLNANGAVIGYLNVHATELATFDADMIDLLQLLADDLSFALDTMAANQRREHAETALRQLNATLEQKVEQRTLSLQAANRELEAFSYSVSHDLRAPLRAISGFTELLAEGHLDRLDHEARGYLERVRAASQRMSRLIDDLMNLSRIARMELKRERVDLSRLALEVIAELQESEPQRAVHVRVTPGLSAHADRGLTQIVLANLLGNAWKFTVKRPTPSISFGTTQRDGATWFFVRDNGAGFDMQRADKLFAPFQRLHAEQEFAGTGIGLALVQRIVHRHGGTVAAESAEGEGTTIYFTFGSDAAA
jgi:PAS domain S-box-containing protein